MPLGQRRTHVPPERRLRIRDPRGDLLVCAENMLPKVEAGNIRAPAALARMGDVSKDGGEVMQRVSPAPDRLRSRLELAHGVIVQRGEGRVPGAPRPSPCSSSQLDAWSKSRLPGASSA